MHLPAANERIYLMKKITVASCATLTIAALCFSGCSLDPDSITETINTVQEKVASYSEIASMLANGDYDELIENIDRLVELGEKAAEISGSYEDADEALEQYDVSSEDAELYTGIVTMLANGRYDEAIAVIQQLQAESGE